MRKYQLQQILDIISTMKVAQTTGLYSDAQQGAIAIGKYIEKTEKTCKKTIALIEEYYELVYRVSVGEKDFNIIDNKLNEIESSILNEIQLTKIQILFISYKASMADSLLSIYREAEKDKECNAIWLPVPYYDKDTEGRLKAMKYEGAEYYDDDVKCTDWEKYDIEAARPDIILTFNPYDEFNRVTSIHPNFYCSRLSKITDLLVYVPYFIVANNVAEHFVTLPGILYADKVIVQSDKIRDSYIYYYKANFNNKFSIPKEKFVGIGSPKIDMIVNSKREDFKIPIEWKKIIKGKKIILYNTSLGPILSGDEQYLKKIKIVIDTFIKNEDTVLWWRPHPLSQETFSSMRPKLIDEYLEIVNDFIKYENTIYDTTENLHRAIAISDIYYGDIKSSLWILYCITGKPSVYSRILNKEGRLPTVKEDFELARDNTSFDVLNSMSNNDGTAGIKIYEYIKNLSEDFK